MLRLDAVTLLVPDPAVAARFWATLLDRPLVEEAGSVRVTGDDRQPALRFVADGTHTGEPDLLHLHVTSTDAADQERIVATALDLGAQHRDVGQLPSEPHVVLADPAGNAFCVIGPGNSFLDGCGFLGEIACDGTRDVGVFWSRALGWPLVWDSDGETAIQAPVGGTKIAWGGPPVAERNGLRRQRFDVRSNDPRNDARDLRALGAIPLAEEGLADPDGNDFRIDAG